MSPVTETEVRPGWVSLPESLASDTFEKPIHERGRDHAAPPRVIARADTLPVSASGRQAAIGNGPEHEVNRRKPRFLARRCETSCERAKMHSLEGQR